MARDATALASPTPLWKNRDYLLLWCGQAVSVVGTQVSQIAFPLLVLALTGSPAQAGFVAAARTVPYLLFALPLGVYVDRWNRKLTMIVCNTGSGIALGSVVVAYALGSLTIAQVAVVSFVEGTFALVFGLAETSALPHVVHRSQLPAAVAQQQMQYSVGAIVGPPLGGALFAASPLLPFSVDACSYAASGLSLAAVRADFQHARAARRRSLRAEIAEGIVWLWRQPIVRSMALLTGGFNFATAGETLALIVLMQGQGATPATIGTVFAVGGAGGILGALLAPQIQRRLSFGRAILLVVWLFAAGTVALAFAPTPALVAAGLAALFLVIPAYDTVQLSYRLALIPDALQGRVNSVFRLIVQGMRPLGAALTGVSLEWFGPATTLLVAGGVTALVALYATLNRHVRHAPPLAEAHGA